MPLVGTQAPDFTSMAVVGDDFEEVTLSDNWKNGKFTCLFFYPFDFTFVCPTEIIAFSDAASEFEKRGCSVLGVSIDSKFTHLAWKNTPRSEGGLGRIDYPLVEDVKKEIQQAYDVAHPNGASYRGLFIIDDKGVVRHMLVNDLPLGRNVNEALRMVDAIQYTDKHGEVCPAGWTPGDDTIDTANAGEYFAKANAPGVEVTA